MKTALIITGGDINPEFATDYISKNQFDMIIAADGGLASAEEMNLIPDIILGDFDTVNPMLLSKYAWGDRFTIGSYDCQYSVDAICSGNWN